MKRNMFWTGKRVKITKILLAGMDTKNQRLLIADLRSKVGRVGTIAATFGTEFRVLFDNDDAQMFRSQELALV